MWISDDTVQLYQVVYTNISYTGTFQFSGTVLLRWFQMVE